MPSRLVRMAAQPHQRDMHVLTRIVAHANRQEAVLCGLLDVVVHFGPRLTDLCGPVSLS